MGRDSKRRAEIRHFRKLFGGTKTAEQVHQEIALKDKKCQACGRQAAVRCRFFASVVDLHHQSPQFLLKLAQEHSGQVPVIETRYGKMIRISDAYSCSGCRPTLEKEAAKAPSWVLVDFDFGPGPDKPVVQVA